MPNRPDETADELEAALVRQNLKQFREELEMTQPDAALEADIPLDSLRRLESGAATLDVRLLRRLATAYRRRIEDLFEQHPPPPPPGNRPVFFIRLRRGATYNEERYRRLVELVAEANDAELAEADEPTGQETSPDSGPTPAASTRPGSQPSQTERGSGRKRRTRPRRKS